jgi:hypothetical protein
MVDASCENKGYTLEDFVKISRTDSATLLTINDEDYQL